MDSRRWGEKVPDNFWGGFYICLLDLVSQRTNQFVIDISYLPHHSDNHFLEAGQYSLITKVIKAYLIAEEQQYRGQFLPSRRSVLCLLNLAVARLYIFVCLHHQFVQGLTPTANTAVRANSVLCPDSAKRYRRDSITYNITTLFDLCSSHIPWS